MTSLKKICLLAALVFPWTAYADPRLCYPDVTQVPRDAAGNIKRSTAQRAMFVRDWPCPATHEVTGSCPGWAVDHIIPLAVGGCDAPQNMQWLPLVIKACASPGCKDRWERKVYARPQQDAPL